MENKELFVIKPEYFKSLEINFRESEVDERQKLFFTLKGLVIGEQHGFFDKTINFSIDKKEKDLINGLADYLVEFANAIREFGKDKE